MNSDIFDNKYIVYAADIYVLPYEYDDYIINPTFFNNNDPQSH